MSSGLRWPRRGFLRPTSRIDVKILPAIALGMSRKEMLDPLVEVIESTSNRLSLCVTGFGQRTVTIPAMLKLVRHRAYAALLIATLAPDRSIALASRM